MTEVTFLTSDGAVGTMGQFVSSIISGAMADSYNLPYVPAGNRFQVRTSIVLMDEVDTSKYIVQKVGSLDFWNEISGFFHKYRGRNKVYDFRETDWEIPEDVEFADKYAAMIGDWFAMVVGDRIVDKNYDVWKVIGFRSQNGSEVYGNIL